MYFSIRVYVLGSGEGPGGTLGVLGLAFVAGTMETLAYTRPSTAEFCYPTL